MDEDRLPMMVHAHQEKGPRRRGRSCCRRLNCTKKVEVDDTDCSRIARDRRRWWNFVHEKQDCVATLSSESGCYEEERGGGGAGGQESER